MTITWTVNPLERRLSDGYVSTAHWRVTAVDGEFSASTYGTCGFHGELTTPYEDLTEAEVLTWVWAQVDKASIEASLEAQIAAQQNPVTALGVPWSEQ